MRWRVWVGLAALLGCGGCNARPIAEADGGAGSGGLGGGGVGGSVPSRGVGGSIAGGGSGGAGGAGGSIGGAGGSDDPVVCANLACLEAAWDVVSRCPITGSCLYHWESAPPTTTLTRCYGDGARVRITTEKATGSDSTVTTTTTEVKEGDASCFSRIYVETATPVSTQYGQGTAIAGDLTTLDGAGLVLSTIHMSVDGTDTVTCPGGPPTVVPPDRCGLSEVVVFAGAVTVEPVVCNPGTCDF